MDKQEQDWLYPLYAGYSEIKKLDFIVQSIKKHLDKINLKGLDLDCGVGNITILLASLDYNMIGIDISPANINAAKSKQINRGDNPTFLVGDAENLVFEREGERERFDFVIFSEVMVYIKNPINILNSINKVLKKDGILILTVTNSHGPYSLIYYHFRNKILSKIFPKIRPSSYIQMFTLNEIKDLLKKTGFEVLNVNHSDFTSFLPLLAKSKRFCCWDCKLADNLSPLLVSGYYIVCRKK